MKLNVSRLDLADYKSARSREGAITRWAQRQAFARFVTSRAMPIGLRTLCRSACRTVRHRIYRFLRPSGFATSRAVSMKSRATGLSVRFFRVMIPTGARACCSLTGKIVMCGVLDNRSADVYIVRKRPLDTRLSRAAG
jgi:hypothetical protein